MTGLFTEKVLSVSELTLQVKFLLEEAFPSLLVSGEITGLSRPASGHVYLTLKDANAQISGVIYHHVFHRYIQMHSFTIFLQEIPR